MSVNKTPEDPEWRDLSPEEQAKTTSPEFIILDAEPGSDSKKTSQKSSNGDFLGPILQIQKGHLPFFLRIVSLFIGFFVTLLALFLGALCLISTVCSLLWLGNNPAINAKTATFWRMFKKSLVFILGFIVTAFNPAFGIGMMTLYLALTGDDVNKGFTARFRSRFTS